MVCLCRTTREPAAIELPDQSHGSAARSVVEHRWRVLHTKSRQEKAVALALESAGVECYLPVVTVLRFYGHRKRRVELPLFAGYVFSRGTKESTHVAIGTGRVAGVIEVLDQKRFEHEVEQVRRALAGGAELQPYSFLRTGQRVRVTAGPFRDVEGLIEDAARADRLVLQVQALGRATSLEIDASLLEPVD